MGGPGSGRKKGSKNKASNIVFNKLGKTNPLGPLSKNKPNPYTAAKIKANESNIIRQTGMRSSGVKVIKNNGLNSKTYNQYKNDRKVAGGNRKANRLLAYQSLIRTGRNK